MKVLVTNYTFSAATKQVTLTDYASITQEQLLLITNVTDNIIIYNFADPAAGGTVSGNVVTLTYDTTSMSNGDRLQIFIDDLSVSSTNNALTGYLQTLTTTVSSPVSAIRTTPVFIDFDSTTRSGGHYPMGGRFVDATSFSPVTSISAVPALSGFDAILNIDAQTGGAVALQGDLDKDIDSVTNFDVGYASISNYLTGATLGTVLTGTGTQVLTANANRITLFGQNMGTVPLFVKYGLGCNFNSFSFILYPGLSAFDGNGEKIIDDRYKGDVSVNTTTGVSAQYIFWEGV